jgi:hypothetical protein
MLMEGIIGKKIINILNDVGSKPTPISLFIKHNPESAKPIQSLISSIKENIVSNGLYKLNDEFIKDFGHFINIGYNNIFSQIRKEWNEYSLPNHENMPIKDYNKCFTDLIALEWLAFVINIRDVVALRVSIGSYYAPSLNELKFTTIVAMEFNFKRKTIQIVEKAIIKFCEKAFSQAFGVVTKSKNAEKEDHVNNEVAIRYTKFLQPSKEININKDKIKSLLEKLISSKVIK